MIKNFVIPLGKDELLRSQPGQYYVENIVPLNGLSKAIDVARTALPNSGITFIYEHFQTFFSVIVHGNKVELQTVSRAFSRITKALEVLVEDLEKLFDRQQEIQDDQKLLYLCVNKMLAYLLSWFICHLNERAQNSTDKTQNIGKRKGTVKKSDFEEQWDTDRQKVLELIYRWLEVPLHKFWQPPIVEDEFVKCITQILYKTLEHSTDGKEKQTRQTIFEILGTLISKYNHGPICVVKLIQLVKLYEPLTVPIAAGVIHMITDCGCQGLVKEIVKEIEQNELGEVDSRNVSAFLENVAVARPDLIIPILDDIIDHLSNEHYTMRNCAIAILAAVVQKSLTGEDLTAEQKANRDECLENLLAHMLDCNAYVRSKVLQAWQGLCCEGAIPLSWQDKILTVAVNRALDKSAIVRKQALQLLRTILEGNPYAAKFNKAELESALNDKTAQLRHLQANVAKASPRGDNERKELWHALLPNIRTAIKNIIEDDNTKEEIDDNETIDPNTVFEEIRQLMLSKKVNEAVVYLWKVCTNLKEAPDMTNLTPEAKEECLFLFLLKIFMESENTVNEENGEESNNPMTEAERKKLQKELESGKRLVSYLQSCLRFTEEFERVMPALKCLLNKSITDVVETCALLAVAYKFGFSGVTSIVRQAMFLIFSEEQSVRNAVANLYKEIYLFDCQKSDRQKALALVNKLTVLMKELEPGQSPAMQELVVTWYKSQELNAETLQVLWEKFTMKLPNTEPIDSRTALMLIMMIAEHESRIITDNLNILVQEGLGPRAENDLLLARDTCRALMRIKQSNIDMEKPPLKYSNDHKMFTLITELLTANFMKQDSGAYISFATDAIKVIFHLADQPNLLVESVLQDVSKKGEFCTNGSVKTINVPAYLIARFVYLAGHIAIGAMVHLDTSVYKELKRRKVLTEMKKGKKTKKLSMNATVVSTPSSASASTVRRNKEVSITHEDNGEEALEGAADDTEAEFINNVLEHEVVSEEGMLAGVAHFVINICKHPEIYNDEDVQASAALALGKMMTVSSVFCEENIQLFVTILEKSPYPGIKSNVLVGLRDLMNRFPNQVEPWTKHIYGTLRDENRDVRYTCVHTLSDLIMREMVRVKGQVSELALCIVDKDPDIRKEAKQLFNELSLKGNALYNVMPDILSRLSDPALNLDEDNFHEILKYILGLIHKERHVDMIIERLCTRFRLANTERQWRDFSYCLTLLPFSAKNIRQLIEHVRFLKDKIHHKDVLKAFRQIINQAKKKPAAKAACIELEELLQKLLEEDENTEIADSQLMPPPKHRPVVTRKRMSQRSRRKSSSEEEDEDEDEDEDEAEIAPLPTPKTKLGKRRISKDKDNQDRNNTGSDSSDDDEVKLQSVKRETQKVQQRKKVKESVADVSSSPVRRSNRQQTRSAPKTQRSRK